jgi:hypothetical protein
MKRCALCGGRLGLVEGVISSVRMVVHGNGSCPPRHHLMFPGIYGNSSHLVASNNFVANLRPGSSSK